MNLIHYAAKPFILDDFKDCLQPIDQGFKPVGLWISDDDCKENWLNWCTDQKFHLERLKYKHKIILRDNAKIKIVKTVQGIDAITKKYARKTFPESIFFCALDCEALANKYDGLIISPYQWTRRLDTNSFWYYCWDCASGCIWNKRAIKEIILLEN